MDIETLNGDISEFHNKYENTKLKTAEELNAYIADAEKILVKYPNPDSDKEASRVLGKFCSHLGCWVTVFGQDLERGIAYYRKSIELDPESYDIRWEYYTTLEELVDDEDYRTPDLVRDAIDCLRFCIDYCDTPELKEKNYIHYRYTDLGRVYMAAGDYQSAKECFEQSLRILPNDNARDLLKQVNKKLGNPIVRFFRKLFSAFRKKK